MGAPSITTTELNAIAAVNPANSRYVGFFGDSRAFLSYTPPSPTQSQLRNVGLAHWLQAYGLNAFTLQVELAAGIAGDTTEGMRKRQPAFIEMLKARGCTRAVFIGSTNDRTAGIDLGISQQNVRGIVDNFLEAGISVIAISETPRGTGSSDYELRTQELKNDHYKMHLWFKNELSKICTVIDVWDLMVDPASGSNYYVKDGMTVDGIHMSKVGAQQVGIAGGERIAAETRHLGDFLQSNVGFNAHSNPWGSLTANPLLEGTDGTVSGSVTQGSQLATGWKAAAHRAEGLTVTLSKETDFDGRTWQKVQVRGRSAAGNGPQIQITTPVPMGDVQHGDRIKATALVRSQGAGLSNVALAILMVPAWALKGDAEDSHKDFPWPSGATGVLSRETPPYQHDGSQTSLDVRFDIDFTPDTDIDASVWFSQCGAFKFTY